MLTNTITKTATLPSGSGSPFALPTSFMVMTQPVGADAHRVAMSAAKKDRPPRGVPR